MFRLLFLVPLTSAAVVMTPALPPAWQRGKVHGAARSRKLVKGAAVAVQAPCVVTPTTPATPLLLGKNARCQGVSIVVSVDWEGSGFTDDDMAAFCRFRNDFPDIALTHFLNAAVRCRP